MINKSIVKTSYTTQQSLKGLEMQRHNFKHMDTTRNVIAQPCVRVSYINGSELGWAPEFNMPKDHSPGGIM